MLDHSDSVRDIVGTVLSAKIGNDKDAGLRGVRYTGLIDDPDIAKLIEKQRVTDVSIGFEFNPECSLCGEDFWTCEHWFDEAHVIARDMNIHELSIVTKGADKNAKIGSQNFKAQFNKNKTDFTKEEKPMVKTEPTIDVNKLVEELSEAKKSLVELQSGLKDQKEILDKINKEKADAFSDKEETEKELKALRDEKEKLEKDFGDVSSKLSDKEKADKIAKVTEIVELGIEKGIFTEEDKEAKIAEYTEFGEKELESQKSLIEMFKKEKKETGSPKIPEIEGLGNGNNQLVIDDENIDQVMTHDLFAYDRTFRESGNKPNQSYMGISRNV